MRLEDLDYDLPPGLIAQHPAERREDARLLVVERATGALHDSRIADLGHWLRPGDALALNETRVRPARLDMRRASGGRVELLVVRPEPGGLWRVLAKPAKKAPPGAVLTSDGGGLTLEVVETGAEGERVVRVVAGDLDRELEAHGRVPLPPYIHRPPDPEDRERYQTVFARVDGAVAAPTAGLHFSEALLESLAVRGVARVPLLLHVGPGTFRPISAADPREHVMDEEWFDVSGEAAAALDAARAARSAAAASPLTSNHSSSMACSRGSGAAMGRNVPGPTCSSRDTCATPSAASDSSRATLKCSPAVGAATAPSTRAKTVW
jgi:S-adenosylmethionine:tRNA ribosyltransferase-isomerase